MYLNEFPVRFSNVYICDNPGVNTGRCTRSWGADLTGTGIPVFDHASEAFRTGHVSDNVLSMSGGNDRTTF